MRKSNRCEQITVFLIGIVALFSKAQAKMVIIDATSGSFEQKPRIVEYSDQEGYGTSPETSQAPYKVMNLTLPDIDIGTLDHYRNLFCQIVTTAEQELTTFFYPPSSYGFFALLPGPFTNPKCALVSSALSVTTADLEGPLYLNYFRDVPADSLYFLSKDKLFFVNLAVGLITEISISPRELKEFKTRWEHGPREKILSPAQLKEISSIIPNRALHRPPGRPIQIVIPFDSDDHCDRTGYHRRFHNGTR